MLAVHDGPPLWVPRLYAMGQLLKVGADAGPAYNLYGTLYLSSSGWLLLSVPTPLVRGVFAAMHEPGAELPRNEQGALETHVSVMSRDEVAVIGADSITERGKQYAYTIGRLVEVEPEGGPNGKAWVLRVHSPDLQKLRRSYGLSSLPRDGAFDFHITCGIRRRGILGRNDVAKSS